jgi:hypothetical protein
MLSATGLYTVPNIGALSVTPLGPTVHGDFFIEERHFCSMACLLSVLKDKLAGGEPVKTARAEYLEEH